MKLQENERQRKLCGKLCQFFVPKTLSYISIEHKNRCNKVVIELCGVQFWSKIILVISNRTRAAHSFDFEITHMIEDQITIHLDQLPL